MPFAIMAVSLEMVWRLLIGSAQLNVIIRVDDRLCLFRGEDETTFYVNAKSYHSYKAVSHVALTTFLMLELGGAAQRAIDKHFA